MGETGVNASHQKEKGGNNGEVKAAPQTKRQREVEIETH